MCEKQGVYRHAECHKHGVETNVDLPTYFPENVLERAPAYVYKLDIQAV
jgi:hypothetical protein